MTSSVALVVDGSQAAGLGHLARSTAVAHALIELGVAPDLRALGTIEPRFRDELRWEALSGLDALDPTAYDLVVLDAYGLDADAVEAVASATRLGWFDDSGDVPSGASLVVAPATRPRVEGAVVLEGIAYAPLGRSFWSPPVREIGEQAARRLLVRLGGSNTAAAAVKLAGAAHEAVPEATVRVIGAEAGAAVAVPDGVDVLDPVASLYAELIAAELFVGAAGQTMLEAAAVGTPALVAVVADNQEAGAAELESLGAVRRFDLEAEAVTSGVIAALASDVEQRRKMSAAGQKAIDGGGARRIAEAILGLVAGRG